MRSWLKPSTFTELTPTQAAWLAGFFDGEGSLTFYMSGRGKNHPTWCITIPNTDERALRRCGIMTGCGTVTLKTRKGRPAHHKDQWVWRVNAQLDVAAIVNAMLPYLVIKQEKAFEFLKWWSGRPELNGRPPVSETGALPD